ncbi:MAG TPA: tRNA 2-selenouridine(34) synthase MnmH [Caulobacteraceae bacterium]|jgi:tRNA 2-selenouridine synthase|nr:tRNA 2-selenouridine(34) synthase MnmH [Caulobacteraceae bacterium]
MIGLLENPTPEALAGFEAILDVRSPAEFAQDHVPGAMNLPVLDDAERAMIGTLYVQESRFRARREGAALVARNIARHLENGLAGRAASFAPLVYCWRGGQRSHAMATVLDQVGWRPTLIAGGYRTWRRQVNGALYDTDLAHRLVLLDGPTGLAKTAILAAVGDAGGQIIDLEGLAAHRGSLFGAYPGRPQPSQKMFESRLFAILAAADPARPILVEAESSKIGEIVNPPALWKAMQAAPRIVLDAPALARARYLLEAYGDITHDRDALDAIIARLPRHHGKDRREAWRALVAAGELETLALELMAEHYDPAYARSGAGEGERRVLAGLTLDDLGPAARAAAAGRIAQIMESL